MIKTTEELELKDIKVRDYGGDDDAEYSLQAIINRSPVASLVAVTVYQYGIKYVGVHGTRVLWETGFTDTYSYSMDAYEFRAYHNRLGRRIFTFDVIRSENNE